jgi:general secretion pathway protein D
VAIDFARKPGPLARMTQVLNREMNKIENGGPGTGSGEKVIAPTGSELANPPAAKPAADATTPPVPVKEPNPETLKVQPELQ